MFFSCFYLAEDYKKVDINGSDINPFKQICDRLIELISV